MMVKQFYVQICDNTSTGIAKTNQFTNKLHRELTLNLDNGLSLKQIIPVNGGDEFIIISENSGNMMETEIYCGKENLGKFYFSTEQLVLFNQLKEIEFDSIKYKIEKICPQFDSESNSTIIEMNLEEQE